MTIRRRPLLLLGTALLLLLPLAGLALLPDTVGRRLVEQRLEHLAGRPVSIDRLQLRLGVPLEVTLHGITVGADATPGGSIRLAHARLPWSMLLGGPVHLYRLDLDGATLRLAPSSGTAGGSSRPLRLPRIDRLSVAHSGFLLQDPGRELHLEGKLFTDAAGLHADGEGRFGDHPLILAALAGPFREGAAEVPLGAVVAAGNSALGARGTISGGGADLTVALGGDDLPVLLSRLHPLLRRLPPVGGVGHLQGGPGRWQLSGLDIAFGPNRVTGDLTLTTAGRARLRGWIGTTHMVIGPWTRPKGGKGPPLRFPEALKRLDADVALKVEELDLLRIPLRLGEAEVDLMLEEGLLRARLKRAETLPGVLTGDLQLDLNQLPPHLDLNIEAKGLPVARMLKGSRHPDVIRGEFSGKARIEGRGEGPAAVLADSSGGMTLVVQKGRIDARLVEKIGQDLIALLFPGKERKAPLNCAVGDFAVNKGRLDTRTLLFATPDTVVRGEGSFDLVHRRVDLTLRGEPRGGLRLTPQAPVKVAGALRAPHASAETDEIAGKAAGALALGALVTPLAALVPFLAVGDGDNPCAEFVQAPKG